jgi:hypothetical protein
MAAMNFDLVREIGLQMPGVVAGTAYGGPALKVQGKLLAGVPTNRSAEPGSMVMRVGFEERAELLAEAPEIYYVTEHYEGYDAVLVRLDRVSPDVVRDLLGMAYRFVTRKQGRSPRG